MREGGEPWLMLPSQHHPSKSKPLMTNLSECSALCVHALSGYEYAAHPCCVTYCVPVPVERAARGGM